MFPLKIKIKNIGPYRDLDLDLESLPGTLTAVVGRNGEGKSFLLTSIFAALYRTLPDRPAGIYRYCTARHAGIELTWRLNGVTYTSIIKIDSQALKMEAVLKQHGVDKPLNDGKVRTYDPIIEKLLGSEKQALISSFAAQDQSGSFLQIEKADRKALFIKMLGLEKLQAIASAADEHAKAIQQRIGMSEGRRLALLPTALSSPPNLRDLEDALMRARARVQAHTQKHAELTVALSDLKAQCAGADDLQNQRKTIQARGAELQRRLKDNEVAIEADQVQLDKLTALQNRLAKEQATLDTLQEELPMLQDRIAKLTATSARVDPLTLQHSTIRQRLDKARGDLNKTSTDLRDAERLAEQLPALLEARDRLGLTQQQRTTLSDDVNRFRGELSTLLKNSKETTERVRTLEVQLHKHRAAETAARTRLETAREDATILESVPCQGAGEYAQCKFLTRSVAASQGMDELQSTVDNAVALGLGVQKEIDSLPTVAPASIESIEKRIRSNDDEIKNLERTITSMEKSIATLPQAEAAGHRVALLREQKSSLDQSVTILDVDLEAAAAELSDCTGAAAEVRRYEKERINIVDSIQRGKDMVAVLADQVAKSAGAEERIRNRKDVSKGIQSDLAGVAEEVSRVDVSLEVIRQNKQKLTALQVDVDIEADLIKAEGASVSKYESDIAVAADRIRVINEAKDALAALDNETKPLQLEMAAYRAVQKAFGPMEIQSFEIDAAGPAISTIANDLLFTCFGPRFSIRFVTRTLLADGSGFKDAFDIIVIDQENAREGSIDDLSGGQKVICGEAVRLAIALYNRQKNDVSWDALFRDEASSALDDINAPHYIAMLKQAREIGRFQKVFFVSHQGRVQESADAKIRIENGGATVEA